MRWQPRSPDDAAGHGPGCGPSPALAAATGVSPRGVDSGAGLCSFALTSGCEACLPDIVCPVAALACPTPPDGAAGRELGCEASRSCAGTYGSLRDVGPGAGPGSVDRRPVPGPSNRSWAGPFPDGGTYLPPPRRRPPPEPPPRWARRRRPCVRWPRPPPRPPANVGGQRPGPGSRRVLPPRSVLRVVRSMCGRRRRPPCPWTAPSLHLSAPHLGGVCRGPPPCCHHPQVHWRRRRWRTAPGGTGWVRGVRRRSRSWTLPCCPPAGGRHRGAAFPTHRTARRRRRPGHLHARAAPPPARARLPTSISSPATACAAVGQPVRHRCSRSSVLVCHHIGCACPIWDCSGYGCVCQVSGYFVYAYPAALPPPTPTSPLLSIAPPPPPAVSTPLSYPIQPPPSAPPRPPLPPPPVAFGCAVLPLPRVHAGGPPQSPPAAPQAARAPRNANEATEGAPP
eukprot:gene24926-biopygen19465